jgi:5-methylcytosine-specific restriction endonuclease McrA
MKIIKTLCRRCGDQTGVVEKQNSRKNAIIDKNRYCSKCVKISEEKCKHRMINNNPMFNDDLKKRHSILFKERYKTGEMKSPFQDPEKLKIIRSKSILTESGRERLRNKMVIRNPMFNPEVARKMANTIQSRILSGELVYKKGHTHHLYKGTRTFSNDCRKWLKNWIKSIMTRDKHSCVYCKTVGGYLHIHHIRPLRDIIKKILTKNNVTDTVLLKSNDIHRYENLMTQVVEDHKLEDGITVCKQCHANIDDRYRRIKKTI